KNPGQFVPMNNYSAGGVLKAVGSNLRAVVYVGAGVIAGVLTAVIAAGGIREAWKNGDNIALIGNIAVLTGAVVGTAVAGISYVVASALLGIVGAIAFVLILIGGLVVNLWGKTPLQLWVEKGFWGNGERYFYWENREREDIVKQIEDAEILIDEQAIQEAVPFIKLPSLILTGNFNNISGVMPQLTEKAKDYIMVKNGLEEELYEYLIQSGLQIYSTDNGQFTIFYAEFEKSYPTLANLEIYCMSYQTKER
ncbi:hypothetical protein HYE55_01805, partial [Aggregatibacter actinomycetemcomitans]|nr:hypothetical protein [Aggregatibacter actinomycetemcomitans]MBN6080842.1 hypothetical protein [Aggregatibacter actinomycetemcomitans]MBN6083183.1 hypothetical protein [Aggregatibacter actinomycetemcomitans]